MSADTIWKFTLPTGRDNDAQPYEDVEMPRGSTLLSAAIIDGKICVWAEVDTDRAWSTAFSRRVWVIGTGRNLPNDRSRFVSTVIDPSTGYVWHIYDGGEVL